MELPIEVTTVGELREAVKGYHGIIDVWVDDTGQNLTALGPADFSIGDDFIEGSTFFTIEDLLQHVETLPDTQPLKAWRNSKLVKLIAVGPVGGNVDFSFDVKEQDPWILLLPHS